MEVFRFMGMPDKVLAFDGLPAKMLDGFELCRADGFPRHWKAWMGKTKKVTAIPPEKDLLTGGVRRYEPIVEEDSYFYLVDYNIKPVEEKWQEVCDYVRAHVSKETRLKDKLDDMALPLAPDKISAITLEPEEVVIIPIVAEEIEEAPAPQILAQQPKAEYLVPKKVRPAKLKCADGCEKEFDDQKGLNAHNRMKHVKKIEAPTEIPAAV